MIIGIDYRFAVTSVRGIGYYIRKVVAHLALLDVTNSYILYVNEDVKTVLPSNFKAVRLQSKNLILFEQYYLPRQAQLDGVDVLWYPSNSGPIFLKKRIRLVVTIHDLAFIKAKTSVFIDMITIEKTKFALAELYRLLSLKLGLTRINEIITVSDFSALEIQKRLHRKAVVIHNHVEEISNNIEDNTILERLGINSKNYIYTIAGEAPHKNLSGYIRLFKEFTIKKTLVISGVYNPKLILKYSSPDVIFTGTITESEKKSLYNHAACFLLLSYQEGFGIPILEAMQFGLPIISSDGGSLPEIGDGAVTLVDPNNLKQVALLLNATIESGFVPLANQKVQLKKFSNWTKSAKSHLEVFITRHR
ncbi:MAG TPA: glycosyltransferase family 1 protein [Pedobacter sp.]|uniref:glycosyltransferase family 4 protein n=1 Tax=Pedobacter sp. TaxID=1411316 RepID=UPI002CF99C1D|nr:glycosyltransferase family 1 protein [Pedobacter sp.]HMI00869.1 glycosyltransferase family 1 protein [Pedobacter sp.]